MSALAECPQLSALALRCASGRAISPPANSWFKDGVPLSLPGQNLAQPSVHGGKGAPQFLLVIQGRGAAAL